MSLKINQHMLLNYFRGAAKVVEDDWQKGAQSAGLTQAEQHTLWVVYFEGRASISTIAKYGLWDRSTVMQVVKRLKEKGFVHVEKDDKDLRVSYVLLTEEGKKRHKATKEMDYEFLTFMDGIMEEDPIAFNNLLKILEKINRNYYGEEFIHWVEQTSKWEQQN